MASSKRSSSASAAIIGGNEDLLIELLLYLPAKPLFKFKAVSKNWRSLISAPSFCRRHTLHHRRRLPEMQHAVIFSSGSQTYHVCSLTVPRVFAFQFDLGFPEVEVLQSCNGLLLLRCRRSSSRRTHYYVFNPTTRQQRGLSPLPFTTVAGIYLIFDPSTSPHYTVVCFVFTKTCTRVYLYGSEIHRWKLQRKRIPKSTIFYDGVYFNGGIYFFRLSTSSYRFTLEDNLTNIPSLPLIRSCGRKRSYVHPYRGRRNYPMESNGPVLFFSRKETNVLDVYKMKEVESGWSNKYEVDMKPFLDRGFDIDNNLLCVIVEKEEDMLVFIRGGELISYRLHGAVFELLADFTAFRDDNNEGPSSLRNADHFIQSLAPV